MFEQVLRAELQEICRRRAAVGLPPPPDRPSPDVDLDLVGLALSGGGIRSASFCLGVLQSLAARQVLRHVDYLSTVSGGGLIGATMTSTLQTPGTSPANETFPLGFDLGTPERPAVRYLRQADRYLAPGGLLDTVRLPAIMLRGILDNAALLLPLLMILVTATEVAYGLIYMWGADRLRLVPPAVLAMFALAVLIQPVLYRLWPGRITWAERNRYEAVLAVLLLALVVMLVAIPIFLLEQAAIDTRWDTFTAWIAANHVAVLGMGAAGVIGLALIAVMAQKPGTPGRVAIVVLGAGAHAAVLAVFLLMTLYQVDSPVVDRSLAADLDAGRVSAALVQGVAPLGVTLQEGAPIVRRASSAGGWEIQGGSLQIIVRSRDGTLRLVNSMWDGARDSYFLGLGLLALLYGAVFFNPNITSPHQFFRDRMSRAFVFRVADGGRVLPADGLKLSELGRHATGAPYHLFNTTLNLQGAATSLELGGRDADFFVLASRHCGSATTGYCATTDLERYDPHMTVATAIAISGAGLAPNGGTATVKPLVYLTTLLNLRLDYWMPNPAWVRGALGRRLRLGASVSPTYLLKEAFSRLDAKGPYVNLSDGGHIENLGVYELLRRRCRWIMAVDASEDQSMSLGCLMDVIRYARIDLGIEIDIDVDLLRPGANGFCTAHYAIGAIHYGNGEIGQLVYVKSSLTGDEPPAILQYRAISPTFPQESSADQFFDEGQFESYRALGAHIAAEFLDSAVAHPWSAAAAVPRGAMTADVLTV